MTTGVTKIGFQSRERAFATPLPGPLLFHIELADAVSDGQCIRDHDDDPLLRNSKSFLQDLLDFMVGEVFKNATAKHRIKAAVFEWQRLHNVGSTKLAWHF